VSVRVKVDEDLPRQVADLLTERGHDAATVVEQSWQGVPDEVLWPRVQAERRWLITADKGFADLRCYPPGNHAGVILLRPQEESRRAYLTLARNALDQLKLDDLTGAVVVVTFRGIRVRRATGRG
jgi:predicted nuclease of predicted toxin-antitoxin system